MTKFLCSFLFCCCLLPARAFAAGTLSGSVKGHQKQALADVMVRILNTTYGATTDEKGDFLIANIPDGRYKAEFKLMGHHTQVRSIDIKSGETSQLHITLENSLQEMNEVAVLGRNVLTEVSRQSYNVTAINAAKLHNTTLDLSHALDRVSGIRVREEGGVGSRINFSLNGFTGKQVRFFIDGVPMDNFGSSFQINNLPINLAERIEVYKGVVPIWLGADALGGAVNIVTSSKARSYLDVSYSFGSFNTHKSTLNAGYTSKSGFTAQLNAFQNYSDNNYWVHVDVADVNTGKYYPDQRVRRFHDNYHNETIIGNIGFVNKKFADQLLLGITLGKNHADVQTGARIVSVFGNYYTRGNIVMPSLKYAKNDLFVKGLNLRLNANYNLGEEQVVDTVYRRYNWFQQYKEYPGLGSERSRSLYTYRNNNGLATANLSYQLGKRHSFMLNNVFNTFDRIGSDPLKPGAEVYEQPQKLMKNVTGLGYKFDFNKRWSTSLFYKSFWQKTTFSQSYNPSGNWGDVAYLKQENTFNNSGYGIAMSYFITSKFQVKASAEQSYRLPDTYEMFGDLVNLDGNLSLKPEMSRNYNLGANYNFHIAHIHKFSLDGNILYRDVKDFIRATLNNNQTKQVMENRDRVTNTGLDAEVRYSYKKAFTMGFNVTYQNLRNKTKFEPGSTVESVLYNDRIPNMPFLFGNADASYFIHNAFKKGNTLSIGYNMLYVHAYYLYWPSLGKDKLDIPMQLSHDLNMVYAMAEGKYNIALECKNVLDSRLYDNFSLQKPGRAFNIKLRYFIQSKPSHN